MTFFFAGLLALLSMMSPHGGGGEFSGIAPVSGSSAVHTDGGGGEFSGFPIQP